MSDPIRVAHWRDLPLGPGGRSLVEASAGTGKTWTIGVLWWRLLLEPAEPIGVERIVVTTFTDAAAQELRERLRSRLREALALAGAPPDAPPPDGEDIAWLLARWRDDAARRVEDRRRLLLALADFDRAPISTLHRLCRGLLAAHPLESGQGTEPGEPTSGSALLDELAHDAWRALRQGDRDELAGAGLGDLSLASFRATLGKLLRPGVRIGDGETLDEVRAALAPSLVVPLQAVVDDLGWFARKTARLRGAITGLSDWLAGADWDRRDEHLATLAEFPLDGQVRPERRAAFEALPAVQAMRAALPRISAARGGAERRFWAAQVARVAAWRDERLAARGQVTFDEMVRQAHDAVLARPALADALFADWPVALVDEFQDTDDVQYGLLDRIYRDASGAPRGRLVMIGDPKQAIYGFRGGDVQAYLRARRAADHLLALDTNQRSSPACVEAINAFFAAAGEGLDAKGEGEIRYVAVRASHRKVETPYLVDGKPPRPLVLHLWRDPPDAQPRRRAAALRACAQQIAAMLADPAHTIGRREGDRVVQTPVQPDDLAVLLPTQADIARLREELLQRGVPCVGGSRASVFDGDLAFELQVLLQALASPGDEGALRAALLTRLWGGSLADVAALDDDPAQRAVIGDQLLDIRLRWRREGVLSLVLALAERAAPRLLAHPGGERELSDLRQLGELLQQQSGRGLGPHALLAWLGEQRRDEDGEAPDASERQRRLESEGSRVRLMTLHGAKGLEFPIVFLPLCWNHLANETRDGAPWLLPAADAPGREAHFDPGARAVARREGQDERFRTLYVALTRAVHACHVYALPPDRPQSTSSAKPKGDPDRSPLDALLERLGVPATTPALDQVQWCEGWPGEAPALAAPAVTDAPRTVHPMPAPARLRQRLSFSSLVGARRAASPEEEAAASDEGEAPAITEAAVEAPAHPALQALAGVRGTAFGNAVHAIFELREPGQALAAQAALVARQLARHGVRAAAGELDALVAPLAKRLDEALAATLMDGLRLMDVPPAKQRAEMAFHFALDGRRLDALRAACAAHGEPALVPPLAIGELRGLMTGKIDLVFEHAGRVHVLDYKGNWLGERLADYEGESLAAAMDAHHYRLQALLYTVAVHRYLRQRLRDYEPARHLGEALYLFVRAAGLGPGTGVWRHRFEPSLLQAVDAALGAGGGP